LTCSPFVSRKELALKNQVEIINVIAELLVQHLRFKAFFVGCS